MKGVSTYALTKPPFISEFIFSIIKQQHIKPVYNSPTQLYQNLYQYTVYLYNASLLAQNTTRLFQNENYNTA